MYIYVNMYVCTHTVFIRKSGKCWNKFLGKVVKCHSWLEQGSRISLTTIILYNTAVNR